MGKAAGIPAPDPSGGSSPPAAGGGFSTPRARLSFGVSPAEAAAAVSAPRAPWKGIAKGGEVDSPSAPAAASARSPPREVLDMQMLELIRDMRYQIKTPAAAPQKNLTADEMSALVKRGGNPLALIEF